MGGYLFPNEWLKDNSSDTGSQPTPSPNTPKPRYFKKLKDPTQPHQKLSFHLRIVGDKWTIWELTTLEERDPTLNNVRRTDDSIIGGSVSQECKHVVCTT